MDSLIETFEERLSEVEAYCKFIESLDAATQTGAPRLEGIEEAITTQQQRIIFSGVYLHLYNLVESTMTSCIDAVANLAFGQGNLLPSDLSEKLFKEWIRTMARTHVDLTPENRLNHAIDLCAHLAKSLPTKDLKPPKTAAQESYASIEKGGGGNWDDLAIETICDRIGCRITISQEAYRNIKRKFSNDMGPLTLVKSYRNRLAHGSISFAQCSEDTTASRLIDLKDKTVTYMREVVQCFSNYIAFAEYLTPEKRPA